MSTTRLEEGTAVAMAVAKVRPLTGLHLVQEMVEDRLALQDRLPLPLRDFPKDLSLLALVLLDMPVLSVFTLQWQISFPEEPSVKKYFFINRDLAQTQLRAKGHPGRLRLQQQRQQQRQQHRHHRLRWQTYPDQRLFLLPL
jgi:hypothetical protein